MAEAGRTFRGRFRAGAAGVDQTASREHAAPQDASQAQAAVAPAAARSRPLVFAGQAPAGVAAANSQGCREHRDRRNLAGASRRLASCVGADCRPEAFRKQPRTKFVLQPRGLFPRVSTPHGSGPATSFAVATASMKLEYNAQALSCQGRGLALRRPRSRPAVLCSLLWIGESLGCNE